MSMDPGMLRMMTWPTEYWLRLQGDLLRATGPAISTWLDRRRDGTTAALDTLERLVACHDLTEAASVQQEWIEGAVSRLESDFRALTDNVQVVTRETTKAAQHAAQSVPVATQWKVRQSEAEAAVA